MKTVFVFLFACTLSVSAMAQLTLKMEIIPADQVPEVVLAAQSGQFPGLAVNQWEKQTANGPENEGSRFVATFTSAKNQVVRARYAADGTGLTASTAYLNASQFPSIIQSSVAEKYPDYKLINGQNIQLLATGTTIFQARLRQGTKKLVVYLDASGDEISRSQVPAIVLSEEAAQ